MRKAKTYWYTSYFDELYGCIEFQGFGRFSKEAMDKDFFPWGDETIPDDFKKQLAKIPSSKRPIKFYKLYPDDVVAVLYVLPGASAGPKSDCAINIILFYASVPLQRLLSRLQGATYDPRTVTVFSNSIHNFPDSWRHTRLLVNPPKETTNSDKISWIRETIETGLIPLCKKNASAKLVLKQYQGMYKINPASAVLAYLFSDEFDQGLALVEQLWIEKIDKFERIFFITMSEWDEGQPYPSQVITESFVEKIRTICHNQNLDLDRW